MGDRFADHNDNERTTIQNSEGLCPGRIGPLSKEFSWLGSSWDCKKKRKHYQSFRRNGITISVHSFVYVMAEEYKRLVAYVEDLYEDMQANKMVVVRWFHKVDEVDDIVLPLDINDREIFFSLSLQELSVECIDGLAAVLSAQDFDKFQKEERNKLGLHQPYLCRRQFDNDEVKPFDIKQVKGYWGQDVLRYLYATPSTSLKLRLKITHHGRGCQSSPNVDGSGGPKERSLLNDADIDARGAVSAVTKSRGEKHANNPSGPRLLRKELLKQNLSQQKKHLAPGSHVEVLSQDSGIRGCWFRCVVLKRHHDKVKVRYEDVQDADGTRNLEEWVLASRVASSDKLGIWSCARQVVRPYPSHSSNISSSLDVGSIVDAWWHDGWWEGIVIHKELEGKLRIYFPGEQRDSVFSLGDLRPSEEWVSDKWNHIKDRQDVASSLSSTIDHENRLRLPSDKAPVQASETEANTYLSCSEQPPEVDEGGASIPNLSKICYLDGLKWSSSRKRRRGRELSEGISKDKRQRSSGSSSISSSSQEDVEVAASNACSNLLLPKTLSVVDNDNCKIGGSDPMLVAPMALCSNLVMSQ
ncbi:uncharacterized protein LOC109844390 isoform X2 [Asparagus officinalis]|nr:uncharacterized protein LOC109844390 isoform X2 [Asparagus officinalis]